MTTLAEICRAAGPAYLETRGGAVLPSQRRALADIAACRTPELGGSLYVCHNCGRLEYAYHSCRNRHCPACQGDEARAWADRLQERLLPCGYFLLTFTLPQELRPVARSHQRIVYDILLREAAASVAELTADPAWLGARPGIVADLHTWNRDSSYHPHAHLLVTAGGLTSDGSWRFPTHRGFLVPGRKLSPIFRERVRRALEDAGILPLVPPRVWRNRWVVHVQDAGSGTEVGRYLARYVHRVALTNHSLVDFDGRDVTFRYQPRDEPEPRLLALPVLDFLDRFLEHVLPRRFVKVRYSGLFATRAASAYDQARRLLLIAGPQAAPRASARPQAAPAHADSRPGSDPCHVCRACGGTMILYGFIPPPSRRPP